MKASDFEIGNEFTTADGTRKWRVTDVGTRTVVAIRLDQTKVRTHREAGTHEEWLSEAEARDSGWFNGPPYAVAEYVFDEHDLEVAKKLPA